MGELSGTKAFSACILFGERKTNSMQRRNGVHDLQLPVNIPIHQARNQILQRFEEIRNLYERFVQ